VVELIMIYITYKQITKEKSTLPLVIWLTHQIVELVALIFIIKDNEIFGYFE